MLQYVLPSIISRFHKNIADDRDQCGSCIGIPLVVLDVCIRFLQFLKGSIITISPSGHSTSLLSIFDFDRSSVQLRPDSSATRG